MLAGTLIQGTVPSRGMVSDWMLVATGGAIGALLRYSISETWPSETLPWATLTVNALGSLLLGLLTAALIAQSLSDQQALLLGMGLLGAFTTMSTFSVELVTLADQGRWGSALGYMGATMVLCPLLAWLGWKGGQVLMT